LRKKACGRTRGMDLAVLCLCLPASRTAIRTSESIWEGESNYETNPISLAFSINEYSGRVIQVTDGENPRAVASGRPGGGKVPFAGDIGIQWCHF